MSDPMSMMDFTLEEGLEADEKLRTRPSARDARICACGHPAGRHHEYAGHFTCKPTAMDCKCKGLRTVLEASDVRPFLRKTEGAGPLHALGRGLAVAVSKGIEIKWVEDICCDRCKKTGVKLSPVPVSSSGKAMTEATGFDALLCAECRAAV